MSALTLDHNSPIQNLELAAFATDLAVPIADGVHRGFKNFIFDDDPLADEERYRSIAESAAAKVACGVIDADLLVAESSEKHRRAFIAHLIAEKVTESIREALTATAKTE